MLAFDIKVNDHEFIDFRIIKNLKEIQAIKSEILTFSFRSTFRHIQIPYEGDF